MVSSEAWLIKLKLYFGARHSGTCLYSNYFLLGCREKHIFLRIRSILSGLRKLRVFFMVFNRCKGSLWFGCTSPEHLRIMRWGALAAKANFFFTVNGGELLVYWKFRYFRAHQRFFRYKLGKILGIDGIVLFGFTAEMAPLGISAPCILLNMGMQQRGAGMLTLFCAERFERLILIYVRLLICFLQKKTVVIA